MDSRGRGPRGRATGLFQKTGLAGIGATGPGLLPHRRPNGRTSLRVPTWPESLLPPKSSDLFPTRILSLLRGSGDGVAAAPPGPRLPWSPEGTVRNSSGDSRSLPLGSVGQQDPNSCRACRRRACAFSWGRLQPLAPNFLRRSPPDRVDGTGLRRRRESFCGPMRLLSMT